MSAYSKYELIKVTQEGKIATVLLNRPKQRNVWNYQMSLELKDAYEKLDQDDSVHVVIMTGAGPFFCAGAELQTGKVAFGSGEQDVNKSRDGGGITTLAIHKCRKVTIAAINGPAVGIGITMTLGQDFRITSKDNKIGFVFAGRGIVNEACSSFFLPKLIGYSKAIALSATARVVPASHDWSKDLFAVLTQSADQVLPEAQSLAKDLIARCSPASHAMIKNLFWQARATAEEHHLLESICMYYSSRFDGREGVDSFLAKRAPEFSAKLSDPLWTGIINKIRLTAPSKL